MAVLARDILDFAYNPVIVALMKDAYKLLDSGTMLTATPAIEPVDNRKLLGEARSAKLLTTGEPDEPEKR